MQEDIREFIEDPAALEALYRRARQDGDEQKFSTALAECAAAAPDNILLRAWLCRLDAGPVALDAAPAGAPGSSRTRHWRFALMLSVASGALFLLMAADKPPIPVPGEANPLFWIGWAPLSALSLIAFVVLVGREGERWRWCRTAAIFAAFVGVTTAALAWGRDDTAAVLIALHLPFVAWATVGVAVAGGREKRATHVYAFLVQSLEVVVAAGIFVGAGLVFGGLSIGLFDVFGIHIPEPVLRRAAAFGIGLVPVLAVAVVYDPTLSPARQQPSGLARILRIVTWLSLPAALAVLTLYVFWIVPLNFARAFEERTVLIIYNMTIMAVLVVLAAAVSVVSEAGERFVERWLRRAAVALAALTLLLNAYALAAIVSRTLQFGLSPNRHTVLGWNTATLLVLGFLLVRSWSASADDWLPGFRHALGAAMVLPVAWALWVIWVMPVV